MSREDILNNKFEFVSYETYSDIEYMNKFLLEIPEDKHSFFENLFKRQMHDSFLLKDNVFYVSDGKNSYAFKLDEDFKDFSRTMSDKQVCIFYISFVFPNNEDTYSFSFISDSF